MHSFLARSRKPFLLALALLLLHAPPTIAQVPALAAPAYTIAVIKPSSPNHSDDETELGFDDNSFTFTMVNMSLRDAIEFAYDLNADLQVSGGSSWIATAKFNIIAKAEPETIDQLQKLNKQARYVQVEGMVRQLLGERFKLTTHSVSRVLPQYDLVLAKGGSKLTPSKTPEDASEASNMQMGPGFLKGISCTANCLSEYLQTEREIGKRLVIDKTGLPDHYDFLLKWTPDPTGGIDPPRVEAGFKQDSVAPSFFTAIQEQLGLKLVPTKGPVDIIVIDHAEIPSQN